MVVLLVALLSGALSILTPCVLPLLPAILAATTGQGRRRPLGIVLGLVVSFSVALLAFSALVRALGIPSDTLRLLAAGMLLILGVVLLVPALERRFEQLAGRLAGLRPRAGDEGTGFWSGTVMGAGLGVVWAPCVGPIIAGVAVTASTSSTTVEQVARTVAFAIGMAGPLLLIVFGGRRVSAGLRSRVRPRLVQVVAGVVFLATGVLVGSGADARVNSYLSQKTGISSTLISGLEADVLDDDDGPFDDASGTRSDDGTGLLDLGPAPQFAGITSWLNTPKGAPLDMTALRGKVVLIDFWTYSCINCLRTLPYLKSWHTQYEDDGLVIVGVHAPEFEFEKVERNVRGFVRADGIEYPVALDNDFRTWRAYDNNYWPAKYLIDREGRVRYTHFGEGDYDTTEDHIRSLLRVEGERARPGEASTGENARTPETYLGYERTENMVGSVFGGSEGQVAQDEPARYAAPADPLEPTQWTLSGTWTVGSERAVAGADAEIRFHYRAADVFLVLGPSAVGRALPAGAAAPTVVVRDGDEPPRRIPITGERLYTLRDGDELTDQTMRIEVPPGIAAYAFTFG